MSPQRRRLRPAAWLVTGLAVLALSSAGPAAAATKSATDRDSGLRFDLDGTLLTLTLVPQADRVPPDVREDVWGQPLSAVCWTTYRVNRKPSQRVIAKGVWPQGTPNAVLTF